MYARTIEAKGILHQDHWVGQWDRNGLNSKVDAATCVFCDDNNRPRFCNFRKYWLMKEATLFVGKMIYNIIILAMAAGWVEILFNGMVLFWKKLKASCCQRMLNSNTKTPRWKGIWCRNMAGSHNPSWIKENWKVLFRHFCVNFLDFFSLMV